MLPLKICANVECCHDFVASWMLARLRCKWSFDVTQCKYWCNFNASASANVECCRGFMTKMNVGIASVWIKCWRGFMAKTSIGMTSVLMWNVVMASWQKWIVDVASWLRYEWSVECWHRCKWSVVVASWQKWMLAQLRYEWSVDVASMQNKKKKLSRQLYGKRRVLVQLHYKGKWWCDFIADASANIASRKK